MAYLGVNVRILCLSKLAEVKFLIRAWATKNPDLKNQPSTTRHFPTIQGVFTGRVGE
ncbi:hypothetical protein AmaxDRAFT_1873 [Limnospira maxima CS-328]|uniref:Uncharacterized protein n=1 Tax=Limnospira maxima CS-328 TaxID=513049 RepID=B5VZP7_LIMMA|nr:hypothetical protein AmaxDRAFT_1873 [Limnospira maxima CS-328]UWU45813.1 hypothetical protein APLC1_0497 [Arthrospira platensis C1]